MRATLDAARRRIKAVLASDAVRARIRVSHWEETRDDWRQIAIECQISEHPHLLSTQPRRVRSLGQPGA